MKHSNHFVVIFAMCLSIHFGIAQAQDNPSKEDTLHDLERKIDPAELSKIKEEAERLKFGQSEEHVIPSEEGKEQTNPMHAEEKQASKKTEKEIRERSIQRIQTLGQGVNPSKQITQKPSEAFGVGSQESLKRP